MAFDGATYKAAKKYVEETALGLGAVKGSPCTIKSITEGENGSTVVFAWTGADGVEQTSSTILPRGPKGKEGDPGEPGNSPDVEVAAIDGGHRVTITDATGTHTFDVLDGKPGQDGSGVDTEARAQIAALSEEIDAFKEEGGISGGTTTNKSGVLITMDCDEGSEIVIEGETTNAVNLVHYGKNLIPSLASATQTVGVTITPNGDGSFTLNGTATSSAWPDILSKNTPMYLPAGTYTLSADGTSANCVVSVMEKNRAFEYSVGGNYVTRTFTLTEGIQAYVYLNIKSGATYTDLDIYPQLEVGGAATPYEQCKKEVHNNVVLPMSLNAYDGVNTIYTESGDVLTATSRKSVGAIINEAVAKQLAVDWSAYGLPMLYLTGDTTGMTKDDAVDLAYVYGDLSGTASVKWQGSSSLQWDKKNYTIKFDQEFEAVEGWGVQKKYCFKANFIDHSHARNVCSCKLWGQIVKSRANVPTELSSLPNGGAIDGFPCIIMMNGEFHGLYTWNIPKDGWMFGSPKAILCADAHTDATKFKALATLNGDFELEYVEDEDNADWVLPSINTAIQAVMDGNLDTVGQYIDIPSAIDYYIHTVDEDANDGTDKNYILVTFDGVKWYFSAYDRDTVYGLHWTGKSFATPVGGITYAQYASAHALMKLIRDNKTADLKDRAIELRNGIKSEANVATVFSNFIGCIPSQVFDEDARKWPTIPNTSASNLAQILNWYRLRRQVIDKEIDAMT